MSSLSRWFRWLTVRNSTSRGRPVPRNRRPHIEELEPRVVLDAGNLHYLNAVWRDLFGTPASGGLAQLTLGRLNQYAAPGQVVREVLDSDEFLTRLISDSYRQLFRRNPVRREMNQSLAFLVRGGKLHELQARWLGSDLYYRRNGSNDTAFVRAIHRDLAGPLDPMMLRVRLRQLQRGVSRQRVAQQILTSPRALEHQVNQTVRRLLGRDADAGTTAELAALLRAGGLRDVLRHLLASPEYFRRNVPPTLPIPPPLSPQLPTPGVGPTASLSVTGTVHNALSFFDVFFDQDVSDSALQTSGYGLRVEGGSQNGRSLPLDSISRRDARTVRVTLGERLEDGGYRFSITPSVTNLAGDPAVDPDASFAIDRPVGIIELSPANGATLVNMTRETIVRFDDAIDPATITEQSFFLTALGERIPGRIQVSSTERFATFFYDEPLPSSTRIRVEIDGNLIRGRDGLLLDADGDGVPGGRKIAEFQTLPLTRIPGTNIIGTVRDSYTGAPIIGATIRVDAFPEANAVTDENGRFELVDMPAPDFFVHIDGSTATNAPPGRGYPSVGKPFHSIPGQTMMLKMNGQPFDVYLPSMAFDDVQPLDPNQMTEVGFGAAGLAELAVMFPDIDPAVWLRTRVGFAPGSAQDESGTAATMAVILPVPPSRIPAPLPPQLQTQLVISVQAGSATNFDVPAPATFPNLDSLPPGEKAVLWSFDHDAGYWVPAGLATVSEDGLMVVSDPGTGILAPGWHLISPPLNWVGGGKPRGNEPVHQETPPVVVVRLLTTGDAENLSLTFTPPPGPAERVGQHDLPSGPVKPTRVVEITVEGSFFEEFYDVSAANGLKPGRTETITLRPGDAPVMRTALLRTLEQILARGNGGRPFNRDVVYGAKITVRETVTLADGSTQRSTRILLPYLYVDVSDDNATDRLLKFRDATHHGTLNSAREYNLRTFGAPLPDFVFSGTAGEDYADTVVEHSLALRFDPSAVGDRVASMKVRVRVNGVDHESVNSVPITGKGKERTTVYLNRTDFIATAQALNGLSAAAAATLYTNMKAQAENRITQLANATSTAWVFDDADTGPSPRVVIDWTMGAAGSNVIGRAISGVDFDTAAFRDDFVPQAKRDVLGQAQEVFLFDAFFNRNANGVVEMYLDKFGANPSIIVLGDTVVHEVGHTLGMVHTDWMGIGGRDIMDANEVNALVWTAAMAPVARATVDGIARANDLAALSIPAYLRGWANRPNPAASNNPFPAGKLEDDEVPTVPLLTLLDAVAGTPFFFDLDFGSLAADGPGGQMRTLIVEALNDGGAELILHTITLQNGAVFTLTDFTPDTTLQPGESTTFTLTFDPTTIGLLTDGLIVEANTPGPADTPGVHTFNLLGVGLDSDPVFRVDLDGVNNFGGVGVGGSLSRDGFLTITNDGAAELRFTPTLLSGGADFSLGAALGVEQVIASGESLVLPVTFNPSALGLRPGMIRFTTNDPEQPTVNQGVVGTGIPSNGVIGPNDFDWGKDFIALEYGGFTRRLTSNLAGEFMFEAPVGAEYTVHVFDPISGLLASGMGIAGPAGALTDVTSALAFRPSVAADTDFDGLPDDIEFAIGTQLNAADSDGDGVSDFAEIQQGLNPLDGFAYPIGVIASLTLPGQALDVAVAGNRAYVATSSHGLVVVDVSEFQNPILLGQLALPGTAESVAVDPVRQIVAVASSFRTHLVSIADPMRPVLLHQAPGGQRVEIADGVAYVTSSATLRAIDLTTGTVLQTLQLPSAGLVTGLAREGTTLYAYVSGNDHLITLDISRQGQAVVLGSLHVSIASFDVGLAVGNGVVWLAGSGLRTVDVSDPSNPVLLHDADTFFAARRFALNGSGLGVLAADQFARVEVYDVRNPNDTDAKLAEFPLVSIAQDVAISRGLAFVTDGNRFEVLNYLPFDNLGNPPTVTITAFPLDADPDVPGVQVLEGASIPIRVEANDDVQIRRVELLVNGQVMQDDVSFPFDFFARVPPRTPATDVVTVQARVTDTGGNSTLSNLLAFALVSDNTPPTITMLDPADDSVGNEGLQIVRIRFSESLDPASANPVNFELRDGNSQPIEPLSVQLREDDRLVQFTFDRLPVGDYQFVIRSPNVTDRAGNVLGIGDLTSNFTLTPRAVLTTTAFDVDPNTPGIQVIEGDILPLQVVVANGVEVGQVELRVNDQATASDSIAPFVFQFDAPFNPPGPTTLTFVARVRDVSGFETDTAPLVIQVLDDLTPPVVSSVVPADGITLQPGLTQIIVNFSEAIAFASTPTNPVFTLFEAGANGTLGDADDVSIAILNTQRQNEDRRVVLTTASLPEGIYELRIREDAVSDRAGNTLGTSVFTSGFTLQPPQGFDLEELFSRPGIPFQGAVVLNGDLLQVGVSSNGALITNDVSVGVEFSDLEFLATVGGDAFSAFSIFADMSVFQNIGGGGPTAFPVNGVNISAGEQHAVRFEAFVGGLRVQRLIVIGDGQQFALIATRVTNLTGSVIGGVAWLENFDPEHGFALEQDGATFNGLVQQGNFAFGCIVEERLYPGAISIGLGSLDERAVMSVAAGRLSNPYDVLPPMPPPGVKTDLDVHGAFFFGDLLPGQTVTGAMVLVVGVSVAEAVDVFTAAAQLTAP